MPSSVTRVAILGATGYTALEAIKILLRHPGARITALTSRQAGSPPVATIHPSLVGRLDLCLEDLSPEEVARRADCVFSCLPHGASAAVVPRFLESGCKVVDFSADYRLTDPAVFAQWYGEPHHDPERLGKAVYGLPELFRKEIVATSLVANPGCFAYTAILSLAPLVKARWIDLERIVVDGMSGSSGAGADPSPATHHSEVGNAIFPYNAVDHRHTYEIEQELSGLAGAPVPIHFTPYYCPFTRGILAACHGFLTRAASRADVLALYREFYRDEAFVRVIDLEKDPNASWQYLPYPSVGVVAGSNYVHIGVDIDQRRGRVVVFGALDNLGKGAASSAIQNMNCMLGLPEDSGLRGVGLHP